MISIRHILPPAAKMKFFCLALFALAAVPATPAQTTFCCTPTGNFANKTTADGLGNDEVLGVFASGSTVYAATKNGLSISTNGGTSFTNKTTANGLGDNEVLGVFASGSTVYAATKNGLSISTDGGTSFANKTMAHGLGSNVVQGVFASGSTVYAATQEGLAISTDGGTSFTNRTLADGLGNKNVLAVFASGSTVYAATAGGLSISTDGGTSFTNRTVADGLGNNTTQGVLAIGSTVYVATEGGVAISTDGGTSFTNRTTVHGLGNNTVRGVFACDNIIYAATAGGLSISTDGGTSFTNRTTADGLGDNSVRSVFASDSAVYVGTTKGLAVGSCNQGSSTTTVTAADATYDGNPHGGTAQVTGAGGLNQSATVSYVGRNGTVYPSTTTAPTDAGDYTASASFAGDATHAPSAGSADYTIFQVTLTPGTGPGTVDVTGYNVTYDGNPHTATGTATGVLGEDLSGLLDFSGTTHTDAGAYATDPWSFAGNTNYAPINSTVSDNIAQVTLTPGTGPGTVNVTGYSVTYDGNAHTATGTATGVQGEDLSGLLDFSGTTHTDAGAYPSDPWSFAGNTNYAPINSTVGDNIAQVTLTPGTGPGTVNVTGYSVTYDGNAHTATGTATGVQGEDLSGLLDLSGTTHTDAGAYPTDPWSFAGNTNYAPINSTVSDNIAQVTLTPGTGPGTVNVTGYSVTYDGNAHTATGTATGVQGEDLSGLLDLSGTTHTDAGAYPTDPWSFAGNTNYAPINSTVSDNIAQVTLTPGTGPGTVNVTGYNVTYDGNPHTATGTATGVLGEDLSGLLDLSGTTHTDADAYPSDPWSFAGNTNYAPINSTVSDNINKATISQGAGINITPYNVAYDGAPHTATGTATGVNGANLNALLDLTGTTHTEAGVYNGDVWTFAGDANHNPANGTVNDVISGRALTVTATGVNRGYDGTTAATVTLATDKLSGDDVTASFTSASFANKNVGNSKTVNVTGISIGGADAGNYTLANTTATAAANIAAREITVTAVPDSRPYNGTTSSDETPTVSAPGIAAGDTAQFIQTFDTPDVSGQKTLTPSGGVNDGNNGNNYAPTFVPLTLNTTAITGAAVQPTITAASKSYDGSTSATIATRSLSGVFAGDSVTLTGGTATFADPNVGSGKTVTATGLSLSGPDAGNYVLTTTTATATADITKANQLITFAALPNKILGDAPFTVTATASSGLPVTLAVKSGPATISGNTVTLTGVGVVTITASQAGDANYNAAPSVDQTFTTVPPPALLNISTRGRVGTGDNVLIGGYIVKGVEPKKFAALGMGPSLQNDSLPDVVADTLLELHGPGGLLAQNDNFADTQLPEVEASGLKPPNPLESAIIATEPPGNYTAIVKDKTGVGGIGLVALYDLSQTSNSILANISTRALVGVDEDVLIGGFIINGQIGAADVILRAIGPSLTPLGVPNALANPTLELRDKDGALLGSNDNWQDDPAQAALIQGTTIPPQNFQEAAFVISLPPSNYTVIVTGKNNTEGVALVEIYDLTN